MTQVHLDPSLLVGEAVGTLNQRGEFVLPAPPAGAVPQLAESDAKARAEAWARQFGPFHRGRLQAVHGAAIDFATLRACPRAYYAHSPYEPVASDAPNYARNRYGPRWLVQLCSQANIPQVILAIAALSTDVTLADGLIRFPPWHGNEFVSDGIPLGSEVPISPESAAELVAAMADRRVASVPELVLPDARYVPQLATWRVTMDNPVDASIGGGSERVTTAEMFVGPVLRGRRDAVLHGRPAPTPAFLRQVRLPRSSTAEPVRFMDLTVRWRPGWPATYAPVNGTAGGNP